MLPSRPWGLSKQHGAKLVSHKETISQIKTIAFYLPQYHPIPENDEWWGPGFTEWTNVTAARPLFRRHKQPHLPSELGFYDLRVPEVREQQARLAQEYGISAFCYWHYWFAGKKLLERPLEEVVASGYPDFPFCIAWANQTWTGVWHGAPDKILIEQTYPGPDDDRAHFEALLPMLTDRRYFKLDGRPLIYIFRPEQLPDPAEFLHRWRQLAKAHGIDGLYLVAEVSDLLGKGPIYTQYREHGFDAGVYIRIPARLNTTDLLRMRIRRKLFGGPEVYPHSKDWPTPPPNLPPPLHPCVYPNWDNTARSGRNGLVLVGSNPSIFSRHVAQALEWMQRSRSSQQLLFIKSWNEWAEGNYLEPDREYGRGYLEALRAATASPPPVS